MIALLGRVLRVIAFLLAARLVLRAIARWLRSGDPRRQGSVELVRDRVCNTFLPRERALRASVAGHEEFFCSAACRDRALSAFSRAS